MNFGASVVVAAGGVAGALAGGLACASAPETMSALTADDIMRVFNMWPPSKFEPKEGNSSSHRTTRQPRVCSPPWNSARAETVRLGGRCARRDRGLHGTFRLRRCT